MASLLLERIAEVFNHHLHLSGSEEMLLLRVAQFVKHGDKGRCACDGVHQQAASTTIGVVWEIRPCEVGLGGKGTFHGNYELRIKIYTMQRYAFSLTYASVSTTIAQYCAVVRKCAYSNGLSVGEVRKKSYLCNVVRRVKRKPLPELLTKS